MDISIKVTYKSEGLQKLRKAAGLSQSQLADLAGIKDYSHIFLTHGGVLDRFDSTLFLAPVVYAMLFLLEKLV